MLNHQQVQKRSGQDKNKIQVTIYDKKSTTGKHKSDGTSKIKTRILNTVISSDKTVYSPTSKTNIGLLKRVISSDKTVYSPTGKTNTGLLEKVVSSDKTVYSPTDKTKSGLLFKVISSEKTVYSPDMDQSYNRNLFNIDGTFNKLDNCKEQINNQFKKPIDPQYWNYIPSLERNENKGNSKWNTHGATKTSTLWKKIKLTLHSSKVNCTKSKPITVNYSLGVPRIKNDSLETPINEKYCNSVVISTEKNLDFFKENIDYLSSQNVQQAGTFYARSITRLCDKSDLDNNSNKHCYPVLQFASRKSFKSSNTKENKINSNYKVRLVFDDDFYKIKSKHDSDQLITDTETSTKVLKKCTGFSICKVSKEHDLYLKQNFKKIKFHKRGRPTLTGKSVRPEQYIRDDGNVILHKFHKLSASPSSAAICKKPKVKSGIRNDILKRRPSLKESQEILFNSTQSIKLNDNVRAFTQQNKTRNLVNRPISKYSDYNYSDPKRCTKKCLETKRTHGINTSEKSSLIFCDTNAQTSSKNLKQNSLDGFPKLVPQKTNKLPFLTKVSSSAKETYRTPTSDEYKDNNIIKNKKSCHERIDINATKLYIFSVLVLHLVYFIFFIHLIYVSTEMRKCVKRRKGFPKILPNQRSSVLGINFKIERNKLPSKGCQCKHLNPYKKPNSAELNNLCNLNSETSPNMPSDRKTIGVCQKRCYVPKNNESTSSSLVNHKFLDEMNKNRVFTLPKAKKNNRVQVAAGKNAQNAQLVNKRSKGSSSNLICSGCKTVKSITNIQGISLKIIKKSILNLSGSRSKKEDIIEGESLKQKKASLRKVKSEVGTTSDSNKTKEKCTECRLSHVKDKSTSQRKLNKVKEKISTKGIYCRLNKVKDEYPSHNSNNKSNDLRCVSIQAKLNISGNSLDKSYASFCKDITYCKETEGQQCLCKTRTRSDSNPFSSSWCKKMKTEKNQRTRASNTSQYRLNCWCRVTKKNIRIPKKSRSDYFNRCHGTQVIGRKMFCDFGTQISNKETSFVHNHKKKNRDKATQPSATVYIVSKCGGDGPDKATKACKAEIKTTKYSRIPYLQKYFTFDSTKNENQILLKKHKKKKKTNPNKLCEKNMYEMFPLNKHLQVSTGEFKLPFVKESPNPKIKKINKLNQIWTKSQQNLGLKTRCISESTYRVNQLNRNQYKKDIACNCGRRKNSANDILLPKYQRRKNKGNQKVCPLNNTTNTDAPPLKTKSWFRKYKDKKLQNSEVSCNVNDTKGFTIKSCSGNNLQISNSHTTSAYIHYITHQNQGGYVSKGIQSELKSSKQSCNSSLKYVRSPKTNMDNIEFICSESFNKQTNSLKTMFNKLRNSSKDFKELYACQQQLARCFSGIHHVKKISNASQHNPIIVNENTQCNPICHKEKAISCFRTKEKSIDKISVQCESQKILTDSVNTTVKSSFNNNEKKIKAQQGINVQMNIKSDKNHPKHIYKKHKSVFSSNKSVNKTSNTRAADSSISTINLCGKCYTEIKLNHNFCKYKKHSAKVNASVDQVSKSCYTEKEVANKDFSCMSVCFKCKHNFKDPKKHSRTEKKQSLLFPNSKRVKCSRSEFIPNSKKGSQSKRSLRNKSKISFFGCTGSEISHSKSKNKKVKKIRSEKQTDSSYSAVLLRDILLRSTDPASKIDFPINQQILKTKSHKTQCTKNIQTPNCKWRRTTTATLPCWWPRILRKKCPKKTIDIMKADSCFHSSTSSTSCQIKCNNEDKACTKKRKPGHNCVRNYECQSCKRNITSRPCPDSCFIKQIDAYSCSNLPCAGDAPTCNKCTRSKRTRQFRYKFFKFASKNNKRCKKKLDCPNQLHITQASCTSQCSLCCKKIKPSNSVTKVTKRWCSKCAITKPVASCCKKITSCTCIAMVTQGSCSKCCITKHVSPSCKKTTSGTCIKKTTQRSCSICAITKPIAPCCNKTKSFFHVMNVRKGSNKCVIPKPVAPCCEKFTSCTCIKKAQGSCSICAIIKPITPSCKKTNSYFRVTKVKKGSNKLTVTKPVAPCCKKPTSCTCITKKSQESCSKCTFTKPIVPCKKSNSFFRVTKIRKGSNKCTVTKPVAPCCKKTTSGTCITKITQDSCSKCAFTKPIAPCCKKSNSFFHITKVRKRSNKCTVTKPVAPCCKKTTSCTCITKVTQGSCSKCAIAKPVASYLQTTNPCICNKNVTKESCSKCAIPKPVPPCGTGNRPYFFKQPLYFLRQLLLKPACKKGKNGSCSSYLQKTKPCIWTTNLTKESCNKCVISKPTPPCGSYHRPCFYKEPLCFFQQTLVKPMCNKVNVHRGNYARVVKCRTKRLTNTVVWMRKKSGVTDDDVCCDLLRPPKALVIDIRQMKRRLLEVLMYVAACFIWVPIVCCLECCRCCCCET